MRPVLLEGDKLAARDGGARFVHVRLGPCQIVAFLSGALGNALVDKLTRRRFDRNEIAARDVGQKPRLLLGGQGDAHKASYQKDRRLDRKIRRD